MRLFAKLMALILVAALAGPFFIKGPDGQPLMTVAGTKAKIAAVGGRMKTKWDGAWARAGRAAGDDNAGKVEMYRWQDEQGQWHYSDDAPASGQAERIFVDPNASRMDPVPVTPTPAPVPRREPAPVTKDSPPGVLSPGSLRGAIDDARAVREAVEERNAEIERRADAP